MKVFVFGAGVSKPAGFPLGNELMGDLRSWLERRPKGQNKRLLEIWDSLLETGIFRQEDDAELNFTRLQVHVRSFPSAVRASRKVELIDPATLFRTLPTVIDFSFTSRHVSHWGRPEKTDYLRNFARRHIQPGDAIVTFNYDCLAEIALREEGRWGLRRGYGLDLGDFYPTLKDQPDGTDCEVIKLHGSVGWRSVFDRGGAGLRIGRFPNPEYEELLIDQVARQVIGFGELEARFPNKSRVVREHKVLPTYLKSIDAYPLPILWKRAGELLRTAERVVFIGYSLPEGDAAARALFLTSIPQNGVVDFYWYNPPGGEKGNEQEGAQLGGARPAATNVDAIEHFFELAGIHFRNHVGSIQDLAAMARLPLA